MITYTTPAAYEDYDPDAERQHGPPSDRCQFHSPTGALLLIMECDLKEFQDDTHLKLDSDVLTPREWQRLIRWLIKNVGLFDVTGNIEIKRQQRVRTEPEYFI